MPDASSSPQAMCEDTGDLSQEHEIYGAKKISQMPRPTAKRPTEKPQRQSPRQPEKADEVDANIRNFAPVARIMKNALPENAKIAKEAKECMQECVSEFISFITSEASEKCHQEKRKTVNGEDIIFAMTSLGFENYAEALKIYLAKYRDTQTPRDPVPRPTSQEFVSNSGPNISDFDSGGAQPSFPTGEPSDTGAEANFTYSSAATGAGGEPSF